MVVTMLLSQYLARSLNAESMVYSGSCCAVGWCPTFDADNLYPYEPSGV